MRKGKSQFGQDTQLYLNHYQFTFAFNACH